MYVTYRKVSVADEEMTCRQEAGWYRGIDMIVPLHVLCEGIFLCHVASDRAWRENVPENILYAQIRVHKLKQYQDKNNTFYMEENELWQQQKQMYMKW